MQTAGTSKRQLADLDSSRANSPNPTLKSHTVVYIESSVFQLYNQQSLTVSAVIVAVVEVLPFWTTEKKTTRAGTGGDEGETRGHH